MRSLFVIGLIAALSPRAFADDGDDTLRFYLSKSDVVLLGEFVAEPIGETREAGVVNYGAEFRIAEVLKGEATKDRRAGGTIKVAIVRFEETPEDRSPELRKGGKAILFLKSDARQGTHITADVWFGIHRASPWMARSLARLAKEPAPDKDARKHLNDDERLALLKPIMSLEEMNRIREGKDLHGKTCGTDIDRRTGKEKGAYGNVYLLDLKASDTKESMSFRYYQDAGKDHYLYEVRGPGFRYEWRGDRFVALEGPPKVQPANVGPKTVPTRFEVTGTINENGGGFVSRRDRGDGNKVLHGLQVVVGAKNWVKESALFNEGVLEQRKQFYPSGLTFRSQVRDANGDGSEVVNTAERVKVVAEKVIVDGGVDIGPIKVPDVICRGTFKAGRRWDGEFLLWEPVPNGFGERLVLHEYRGGKVVKSTPFAEAKLALPPDPEHKDGQSGAWPWSWPYEVPEAIPSRAPQPR